MNIGFGLYPILIQQNIRHNTSILYNYSILIIERHYLTVQNTLPFGV